MKPFRGLYRYNKDTKKLVQIDKPRPIEVHFVHGDAMETMESWATLDKPKFDSKSRIRRHYKDLGFEETGGEHLKEKPNIQEIERREREEAEEGVRQDYYDIKYDRVKFTEAEKELHRREERRLGKAWTIKSPY